MLYLGLAATSLLVLGPATGATEAPLSDLLAVALGDGARILTAVAAVLLTLGAMNAYFAGGSRLGAALGRDGSLPSALAKGSGPGEVPRRSLGVLTLGGALSLVVAAVLDLGLTPLMLLATGCFTLVYVVGTGAALRLLPRWSLGWWTAALAFVATLGLLVVNGLHTIWALGIVAASLAYRSRTPRTRT